MKAEPLALFFTDLHLQEDNVDDVISVCIQMINYAKEYDLKEVYCLGDIFHSRKAQTQNLLDSFEEILDIFQQEGVKFITCVGNHDKTDYTSTASFLNSFKYHPAFHLVKSYEWFFIGQDKDVVIFLLSFFATNIYKEQARKMLGEVTFLKDLHENKVKFILGTHIGIDGFAMNNGIISNEGIEVSTFQDFDYVLVGHFHNKVEKDNIHYIGSALQHSFGEDNDKGAFLLVNTPQDLDYQYLPLEFPNRRTISIDLNDPSTFNFEIGDEITRLLIKGTKEQYLLFDKSKFEGKNVTIKLTQDITLQSIEKGVIHFTPEEIIEVFKQFCEEKEYDATEGLIYLKNL